MLGRPMPYILNLRNVDSEDLELIGTEALINSKLYEENVRTPDGFVFTTRAFDDFLTAANLVDPISQSLLKVKPFSKDLAKKASVEISDLILNYPLPNIVERPLAEAYRNLGDHGNPYLFLMPSNIIENKFIPQNLNQFKEINIRGEKEMIYKIKECWLSLFTPEAVELRANTNYSGILSIAVLIKRMFQSEISGKVYSFSNITQDKDTIEIKALYGFDDPKAADETEADIYLVNKHSSRLIEKNILQQNKMIVRKGNYSPGENPNIKIEISDHWKRSQKLDDKKIEALAKLAVGLESLYKSPIEVTWGLELGEFSILNVEKVISAKKEKSDNSDLIYKSPEPHFEIIPNRDIVSAEVSKNLSKVHINNLVKEVKNLAKQEQEIIKENLTPAEAKQQEKNIIEEKVETLDNALIAKAGNENISEFKFLTPLFLDVSKMNSEVLSNVKKFNGAFLDGTEIILTNSSLPEEIIQSAEKLNQTVNIFTMDIATSSKILENNPLIYQFSNVNEETLKLLGVDNGKYRYYNDDRFIENPESLTVEILALKKARNQMNYKNINLCIPSVKSYDNLVKIKKLIASQGLRRSSSLKMYVEVSLPSFIFELKRLEEGDIDGLIINYERLFAASTGKNILQDNDHKIVLNQIEVIKDILAGQKIEFWVSLRNSEYRKDVIEKLLSLKLNGLILRDVPEDNFPSILQDAEQSNLENLKPLKRGRGRSIKDLL